MQPPPFRIRPLRASGAGSDTARSDPTTVVTAAPPAPAPSPTPAPTASPSPAVVRIAAVLRLGELERDLSAGTRIDITITKPDSIGKWTTIKIRPGAPPARLDRRICPGGRRPVTCPA
jgi:hypothetical protein